MTLTTPIKDGSPPKSDPSYPDAIKQQGGAGCGKAVKSGAWCIRDRAIYEEFVDQ